MKKVLVSILLSAIGYQLSATPVNAVCPVCTIAVGGGVVLSRYFGIDDLITGIWVGGLLVSLGLWTATYIKKKVLKYQEWLIVGLFWLTTYLGFKQAGFIGHPTCKIYGHDKLLSGMIFGTVAFFLGYVSDSLLRKMNKKNPGKAMFPYQRVICPLIFLILATIFSVQLCRWGVK